MVLCTKMNGNGNDFIVINNMRLKYSSEDLSFYAKRLCRRRRSLGADGVLAIEPSEVRDFKMRLFNSDGSEGEMCGNGARCAARFAVLKSIVDRTDVTLETLGGDVFAEVNGTSVTLALSPIDISGGLPELSLAVDGPVFYYRFLVVGVPHAVIIMGDSRRDDGYYRDLGRAIRYRKDLFPEGTNVNFVFLRENNKNEIDVLTYERGVEDLTLSCGTGSVASAIVTFTAGLTGTVTDVYSPGGRNRVTLGEASSGLLLLKLEGSALYIAEADASEEALGLYN